MENKKIEDFTDLELAELNGQSHQELMRAQANLQVIIQEISKRKEAKTQQAEEDKQKIEKK
jgi:hypothetical protein